MNSKEAQLYIEEPWPMTIIYDRYGGTYSKAPWIAFPLEFDEVPEEVHGDDVTCAQFWENYKEPFGLGCSPQIAASDLYTKLVAKALAGDGVEINYKDKYTFYGGSINPWEH